MIGSNTVLATVREVMLFKKDAREACTVIISDTSPTLGWGLSARSVALNIFSANKLLTCLAADVRLAVLAALAALAVCLATTVVSHYCGQPAIMWQATIVSRHYSGKIIAPDVDF